jgi:hypothetical protein
VALGLEDLVVLDRAELADAAVDRADERHVGNRAHARFQRAGKEFIEAVIAGDIGVFRLGHIHIVFTDEPPYQPRRHRAAFRTGHAAGEIGQCPFREQVLRENGEAVGHDIDFLECEWDQRAL